MNREPSLCEKCSQITLRLPTNKTHLRDYPDISSLDDTADRGCALCISIRDSHQNHHTMSAKRQKVPWIEGQVQHSKISVYHWISQSIDLESNIRWECSQEDSRQRGTSARDLGGFFADPGMTILVINFKGKSFNAVSLVVDLTARYFQGRDIGLDSACDANFELAKRWLRECLSSHPLCGTISASPLPTRLIDIGKGISPPNPRLFISAAGANGRYAALSYCWGTSQNNILTKANLKDKNERIPLSSLPKTIHDAVEITRKLGLQYLWVDALCIIQDSVEDWEIESANMGNIYNNAFFTIQASGAKDTKGGCFIPRAPQRLPPAKLRFELEDGSLGSVFVRSHPLVDTKMEPLYQRGWTLQESLLSPRILSYGAQEMSWECKTTHSSEAGVLLQDQGSFPGLPKPIRTKTKNHSLPPDLHISDLAMERKLAWSYVVGDYASRQLTFAKDKLPALSGLARHISHTRPGDTYLAGLWKSEMPSNLLWGVIKGVRHSTYRAPSWSWAALDGKIIVFSYQYTSTGDYCEVLNSSTVLSGSDLFGQVSAGMITLRGPLKEGWRISDEQSLNGDPNVQYLYKHNRHLERSDNTFRLKLGLCELDIFDSAQKLGEPVTTWCLRITNLEGLALQKAPNGVFNRIGTFGLDDEKAGWFEESDVRVLDIV